MFETRFLVSSEPSMPEVKASAFTFPMGSVGGSVLMCGVRRRARSTAITRYERPGQQLRPLDCDRHVKVEEGEYVSEVQTVL